MLTGTGSLFWSVESTPSSAAAPLMAPVRGSRHRRRTRRMCSRLAASRRSLSSEQDEKSSDEMRQRSELPCEAMDTSVMLVVGPGPGLARDEKHTAH